MYPTLRLGALTLPTYSTVYAVALFVAGMIAFVRLRSLEADAASTSRALLVVIAAGFVGTYAIGIVPALIDSLRAGMWVPSFRASYVGTLGFGAAAGIWAIKRQGLPLGRSLDLAGLPWSLFLAIGRIGCLGAGCCYGRPTDSPLGMHLRNVDGQWAVRYPTQIMSGLLNLAIFVALILVERYGLRRARREGLPSRLWPFDGFLFELYVFLLCLERFTMEFLRGDAQLLIGPFTWVHIATLAGMAAMLVLMARGWPRGGAERQPAGG